MALHSCVSREIIFVRQMTFLRPSNFKSIKQFHQYILKNESFQFKTFYSRLIDETLRQNKQFHFLAGTLAEIENDFEMVLHQCNSLDKELIEKRKSGGSFAPMFGVSIAVKDNLAVAQQRLQCGSRMLQHFISPFDASCVRKCRDAGAVLFGRTNMDEFGMGSNTDTSVLNENCVNPFDANRSVGGSSGGSAAIVAADLAFAALGSDTGGSIRQPSSLNNVFGLKPSYGAVSRHGLVAYASSLDTVGVLCKQAQMLKEVFDVIKGSDCFDETVTNQQQRKAVGSVTTIGVPQQFFNDQTSADIRRNWIERIDQLKAMHGNTVTFVPVSLPLFQHALPTYYVIACAEASSNLARYDGIRFKHRITLQQQYDDARSTLFGATVQNRVLLGTLALSKDSFDVVYAKALKMRRRLIDELRACNVDALLSPVVHSFDQIRAIESDEANWMNDVFSVYANLIGQACVSFGDGVQLMASDEERLFQIAFDVENNVN